MEKIVVIGAGTMGNGIAHTAAASGFDVALIDVGDEVLARAMKTISSNLQRGVDKGKMTAEEKLELQGYITRCYGSLTTFNVLFGHRASWFVGQSEREG